MLSRPIYENRYYLKAVLGNPNTQLKDLQLLARLINQTVPWLAMNKEIYSKKKFLALITAFISILIGVIYLAFVFILDFRGPMNPPPAEALISVVAFWIFSRLSDQ